MLSEKLGFNFEVGNTALFFFSLFVLLCSDSCPKLAIPTKAKLLSNVKIQKQTEREFRTDRNNFREQNRILQRVNEERFSGFEKM